MIRFYFNLSPNPTKVALFLEESGMPYEAVPVEVRKGEQFEPSFLALNPNAKVPVIDDDGTVVFDSNAILLYLAEKTGRFLPANRGELLSWLMFVASGVGPFSGQAVHFRQHAADNAYAMARYGYEASRHYAILDARLADRRYLLGEQYSIVDMAAWGWASRLHLVLGEEAWAKLPNLKRMVDEISARPAAARALALKERFTFKTEWDEESRRNMFRHRALAGGG